MNLLIMTGPLFPQSGNNANLIGKLIPHFVAADHKVRVCSFTFAVENDSLPTEHSGLPVYWIKDQKKGWKRRFLYPLISHISDPNGFSDALQVLILRRELKHIYKQFPFDAVLSTSEPYSMAVSASLQHRVKKAIYIMDPPACISNGKETKYRNKTLPLLLKKSTAVTTTPFISSALVAHGFVKESSRIIPVGFPIIKRILAVEPHSMDGRIRLLFCGWLYSDIRSPKYFLEIVSRLDERFEITFMGKECELLEKRFPIETKAKLITLPNQPYETALQAMADADILINIGNSVPVHMPSKTLEYINTGKPFVNFHKMDDCPTLYYTNRYPLCLNMSEKDLDIDAAAERFIDFCIANKGKTVDREYIEREYEDCTPEFIAKKILDALGE